jgi:hypothetical protein
MAVGVPASTAPTPANQTFAALKGAVAASVGFAGDPQVEGIAGSGINNAVRYLSTAGPGGLWSWLLTTDSITLALDTANYDLNNDFKAPRTAELLDSSGNAKSRLVWDDPKSFGNIWLDRSVSGSPSVYTVFNFHDTSQLSLNVPVSQAFLDSYSTINLRYYKRLQTYNGDGATQTIPAEVELFLEMYARWEISVLMRPRQADDYRAMWRNYEIALRRSESHLQVKDFS